MALDQSIYQVLVHDSTGHNPDQWMSVAAFNALVSSEEAADIKDMRKDILNLQLSLTKRSVVDKLVAIEDGIDAEYEALQHKFLVTPYIGTNHPAASLSIPLSPSSTLKLSFKEFGASGGSMTITQDTGISTPFSVLVDGLQLVATLGTDEKRNPVAVTAAEFKAAWEALDGFNLLWRFQHTDTPDYTVPAMETTSLVIAANPAVALQSTAAEIDTVVAKLSDIDTVVAKLSDAGKPRTTQVAASAVLTASGTVTAGKTVTVNDVTYTFVTALTTDPDTVPNEVLIGADEDASLTNLTAAINGTAGEGTEYSTGTEQPTDITGVFDTVSAAKITCTATTAGVVGNAYPKATNETNLDWDDTTGFFTGGKDITAAIAGTIRYEDDKIWVATATCTATESNWHYAELT